MPVATVLTDEQALGLSEPVLSRVLGKAGFDHVEISAGPDHDGEEALFVVAVMKPGSPILASNVYADAYGAVDDVLRANGERRFSYFKISRPDEPIATYEAEQ